MDQFIKGSGGYQWGWGGREDLGEDEEEGRFSVDSTVWKRVNEEKFSTLKKYELFFSIVFLQHNPSIFFVLYCFIIQYFDQ